MDYSSEVLKIVEGALKSDKAKVSNYTKLLIDKLKDNKEVRLANSFQKMLSNNSVSINQMSFTDSMKVPLDQESRLPMADVVLPEQVVDTQIVLNEDARQQVEKFITYIDNASKLISSGITVPNSVLLFGPPGCGKSRLAEYLCSKTKLPLVIARLDGMISSYLGSTSKNIRAIFEYAQSVPCILFLDEFDAIAKVRDDNNELGELKRVVNSLLQNIDNLKNGSIVIAATNHEHLLDPAVWRRFGFRIKMDKPDASSRGLLFQLFLGKDIGSNKDMELIVAATADLSGADIEEISTKANIDSVLNDVPLTISTVFDSIFEFLGIGAKKSADTPIKVVQQERADYLRRIDERQFSYSQIGIILGVSKSHVSDLLKMKVGDDDG